jgi:pimeloyl-ACP methyl ester carboxylesterase
MVINISEWFSNGERIPLQGAHPRRNGAPGVHKLFCHNEGNGAWLTMLHGFPTCSWDWAKITPQLAEKFQILAVDFLGFGDSDKPQGYNYSLQEQADLVEALWRHMGVKQTWLLAHDYGTTVAVELLARQAEKNLNVSLQSAVLLNAGVYVELQRPTSGQKLLRVPVLGSIAGRISAEKVFRQQFPSLFSAQHPLSGAELNQHWFGIHRRRGEINYHRLIYYLRERYLFQGRWEGTIENPPVPIRFIWGMDDPVSGRQIASQILRRNPQADLVSLEGVGHYPQLEVPETVIQSVLDFTSAH